MSRKFIPAFLLALSLTLAAPTALGERLPAPIFTTINNQKISDAGVSIFVQAVDADEPLLAFNDDVLRSPASIMKLVTTYAALDLLGPAYQWNTEVWVTGPVSEGRLAGDLVLRGGGDPGLTTERFWTLLREIRAHGIKDISGDLVIDDSLFAPNAEQPGDFDRQPYRAYNVLPNALLVSHNAVEFRITRRAGKIEVYTDPPLEGFRVENRITSRDGACGGFQRGIALDLPGGFNGNRAVLSGAFPSGCTQFSLWRAVLPAPQFADALFRSLWRQLGGTIDGGLRVAPVPEGASRIYEHPSLPLAEQVRHINKWSNNPMTRHLLLTIGLEFAGPPATPMLGRAALEAWVEKRALDMPGLFVDNGSGLSRQSRLTAGGLGRMLLDAWGHPQMAELMSSLPISAVDGTLRRRHNDRMKGRMYLKTGRLDGVASIAGMMQDRRGRRYVVVVIVNDPDAHRGAGTNVQDAVLRWVFSQ